MERLKKLSTVNSRQTKHAVLHVQFTRMTHELRIPEGATQAEVADKFYDLATKLMRDTVEDTHFWIEEASAIEDKHYWIDKLLRY